MKDHVIFSHYEINRRELGQKIAAEHFSGHFPMVHSLSGQARLLASAQTPFGVSHIQKFCAKVPKPCRRGSPHTLRCSEESVAANSGDSTATTVSNGDNITAPEQIMKGRQVYDPQSYETLVQDATKAVLRGITAGENRIEVEFPPPGGSNSEQNHQSAHISYGDSYR